MGSSGLRVRKDSGTRFYNSQIKFINNWLAFQYSVGHTIVSMGHVVLRTKENIQMRGKDILIIKRMKLLDTNYRTIAAKLVCSI